MLAREERHNLIIASSEEQLDQEKSLLASLQSLSIRGFIVAPTSAEDSSHLRRLIDENVPPVLIDRAAQGVECDSVVVDNEGARARPLNI